MKLQFKWKKTITGSLWIAASLLLVTAAFADDGTMLRRNISGTPELETEHGAIRMLPLYVSAQNTSGELVTISYPDADGTVDPADNRTYARPLIGHYTDGPVEGIEEEGYGGFPGHGKRDAFATVSLDDGATWKRTNLSNSADLSSFKIKVGKKWVPYPGDVGRTAIGSDGNKVLVVWVSRYAGGGSPNYAMSDDERVLVAAHLGITSSCTDLFNEDGTVNNLSTPCLYMEDYFGVAGSQGSSDLADEGYPLVGELPFAAVWAARGVILPPSETGGASRFIWFKAERLTSGVRDANRPEVACVKGAGCVVTWQEDPEGIRPGEGEGPGEGWAGAIAHHQTDIWYAHIDWDDFDLVSTDGTYGSFFNETGSLADWAANLSGSPKAAVPISIPVRITDNAMCTATSTGPYCQTDFDGTGTPDFCASTVQVTIDTPEGPTQDVQMCVTEDGRLMRGNTASTRARPNLHGYASTVAYDFTGGADNSGFFNSIDRAWFSMAYEENKGLGEDGEEIEVSDDPALKIDMGKNVWYHTFEMAAPELVSQGLMLNQPAVYPADWSDSSSLLNPYTSLGYNFYQVEPDPVYETLAGLDTTLLQSEIARRPSPITQDWYDAGTRGTVALQLWKQGIIRRGGPADIMGRRFVIPADFDSTVDNPYDYANMECLDAGGTSAWAFTDASNARYVKGLCAAPAINLSGNTVLTGDKCSDATNCLDAFPFNGYFDDIDMSLATDGLSKILEWRQLGPGYDQTLSDTALTSLDDTSWENPYDVAKGHRGFMAGDMIMAIYAWSPNWLANTVGHDNYNLYARRSFDGGRTWTTLPAGFTHTDGITYNGDGTTTCEWYGPAGTATEYPICTPYAAGEFEPARNLSQLVGTRETILDPRYSPTTRSITEASVGTASLPAGFTAPLYLDDTRDPSRFFMVYETGDNTTVAVGEAEPLDLFYSRAVDWGDHYLVWAEETDLSTALPSADQDDAWDLAGFCNEFDALEGSALSESGEASITSSPGGQFFCAIWNQVDFDKDGNELGSDAWFRRVLFLEDYIPTADDGGDTGETKPPKPVKPKKEK